MELCPVGSSTSVGADVHLPQANLNFRETHSDQENFIRYCPLWTQGSYPDLSGKLTQFQFSSVAQSCLTLCHPMDCSMPGLPVHRQLPEFTQIHVHWVSEPSNHLILCRSLLLPPSIIPSIRVFSMNQLFTLGGQSIGISASTSGLPMNTQDWSPLGWTGWISFQSKGLSRVFSNTTVQKASVQKPSAFFIAQLSHPYMTTGKTIALTRWTFVDSI